MGFNPVKQLEIKMFITPKRDSEIVLCNYTIHHTLIWLKTRQYTNLVEVTKSAELSTGAMKLSVCFTSSNKTEVRPQLCATLAIKTC